MPDDEPLNDAVAVGTAAAAAAARVTESVARHVSETRVRERAAFEQVQDQQRAGQALGNVERTVATTADPSLRQQERLELDQAKAWASPERLRDYEFEVMGSDSSEGWRSAAGRLVKEWKDETGLHVDQKVDQGYDSTEQRGKRDAAREEAGVPLDSRRVVATADQMNGQDPTLAAAVGKAQKTRTKVAAPVPDRTRGR